MAQKNRANMLTDIVSNIYNNLINFITGQNAQDRFVNLLDSSPNILSDASQPNGYVSTDANNEMFSTYYNENDSRANIITKQGLGELVGNKFYQINDADGNTKTLQVCAENALLLHNFAFDVQTGEIGTYDITTDVFSTVSGIPDLQQVTDVGFTTTNKLQSDDGAGNLSALNNGVIDITTGDETVTIEASLVTTTYTVSFPDKLTGTETFAMLSDITAPDIQQVLDTGNTSTTPIKIDDGTGNYVQVNSSNIIMEDSSGNALTIYPDSITIQNPSFGAGTIKATALANNVFFELPNKAAGTETFAMLTDIGGLDLEVNGTPNGDQTLLNLIEGVNIDIADNGTGGVTITSLSDRYSTSSITSNAVSNGAKTFTVDADLAYIPLQEVLIVHNPSNHMHATVTSYSGTTLVVDVKTNTGSGTYTSWVLNLDGVPVDAITGVGNANEIAYFTGGQVIASLAVATYPSLTELSRVKNVGSQVVGTTDTNTLTNKRITARSGTVASSATPTINTDNVDYYSITALAAAITSFTTNLSGTPTIGQTLWISITDNGTARAITWGASFESSTITLPTTTVISTRLDVAFIWNEATSKWRCVGTA